MGFLALLIPIMTLSIPIIAISLSHKRKIQDGKVKELELQKEILALEIQKQNGSIKLLEEENRKLDRLIDEPRP